MIVAKFGGSSVRDAGGMKNCAEIVRKHPDISIIILSATFKTTDLLEDAAENGPKAFEPIKTMHLNLLKELNLPLDLLDGLFLEGEMYSLACKKNNLARRDRLYGIGEFLSTKIFAAYLQKCFACPTALVDAREVLITDGRFGRAKPLLEEIKKKTAQYLVPKIHKNIPVVTQGFIGSTLEGETTTLGREGSDYSATLLAEAVGADTVHIWSDIPGIASTDPKQVPQASIISELSYPLATTMSLKGTKMLFPQTLEPARRSGISVFVGSSLNPDAGGTWIRPNTFCPQGPLALVLDSIDGENRLSLIGENIEKTVIDLPELEQGPLFRTFKIPGSPTCGQKVLALLHRQLLETRN